MLVVGREYSYFTNFGLSTQDVGKFNWNGMGNMFGKFKYWSQQKFGRDLRIVMEGYTGLKDLKHIKNDTFDWKAVGKLAEIAFNPKWIGNEEKLRIANPEAAMFRQFILTQGFATMVWDFMMKGPINIPIVSPIMKRRLWSGGGAGKIRNFSSDLISFAMSPLSIFLKMAFWESFGDEEEYETLVTYYLRRSFIGIVPMLGYDAILAIMYSLADNDRKSLEKAFSATSPLRLGTLPPFPFLSEVAQKVILDLWED